MRKKIYNLCFQGTYILIFKCAWSIILKSNPLRVVKGQKGSCFHLYVYSYIHSFVCSLFYTKISVNKIDKHLSPCEAYLLLLCIRSDTNPINSTCWTSLVSFSLSPFPMSWGRSCTTAITSLRSVSLEFFPSPIHPTQSQH